VPSDLFYFTKELSMLRNVVLASSGLLAIIPATAFAQDGAGPATGVYGVLRGGIAIDSKARIDNNRLESRASGELGLGYNLGGFRIEATGGYAENKLQRPKVLPATAFDAGGKLRALNFRLGGYVDLIPSSTITPYIGAGVGLTRVQSRLSRAVGATRINDKDLGFTYQGSAGLAVKLGSNSAVDVGVRHERTTGVTLDGRSGTPTLTRSFKVRDLQNTTALVGLRIGF
jgi:opacity protein-like surface antigen